MSSFAGLADTFWEQNAIIGGLVGVHQFVHIGSTRLSAAALPYGRYSPLLLPVGIPAVPRLNIIGLKRHNYSRTYFTIETRV